MFIQIVWATEFHVNCPIPLKGSNFVSSPNIRSTLDILWSSLFTIFICTWTVQHLTVPPQDDKGGLERTIRSTWKKTKWMLVTLLLPEYLLGKALGEFTAALNSERRMKEINNGRKWTRTHAFYANMGGFILGRQPERRRSPHASVQLSDSHDNTIKSHQPSKNPGFRKEMNDNVEVAECGEKIASSIRICPSNLESEDGLPVAVNSLHIREFLKSGVITELPSKDEINDKSKGDVVVKGIALFHIVWLCIELIGRKIRGLPCAQLEIAALGFAASAFFTYLLWFEKLQDVRVPIYIHPAKPLEYTDKRSLFILDGLSYFRNYFGLDEQSRQPSSYVPNDFINEEGIFGKMKASDRRIWWWAPQDLGFLLGAAIFGACHCLAWNFEFPTSIEQTLWRAASVIVATILPPFYLFWLFLDTSPWLSKGFYKLALGIARFVTALLYVSARIYLLVGMFRSLFYLPPEAFVSTWSSSIPHVG